MPCRGDDVQRDDEQATVVTVDDSGWEGFRNRLQPDHPLPVKQDFGYSATNRAGGQPGEIGGRAQRSLTPSRYGKRLAKTLTFDDRLEASGRLAVTHCEGGSGVLIGWYHTSSRGWRTPNSLGFRIDGNANSYWLFYEYGTSHGRTHGAGAFEGDRYQTTPSAPFPADGTVHDWSLTFDPAGGEGFGEMTFRIDDQEYRIAMREEDRADNAVLDHFGIWNQETTGGEVEFWLDDLTVNGESLAFDTDPKWEGSGNRAEFVERVVRPFHDFGRAPADVDLPGAVGGIIFRDESPAYYAAPVGPFSLDTPLRALGTISLRGAGADSAVYIGWFDSETKRHNDVPENEKRQRNYLAALVEGPSRVGHYFRAGYATADGSGRNDREGPILPADGSLHHWSIEYDPAGGDGLGTITTTLDDASQTMTLGEGDRKRAATLDRFGLFNGQAGGWHVDVYVDELEFTSQAAAQ
ncbi:MAG: hypothetical protein R3C10_16525 [Pirellulales bacterium]